MSKKVREFLFKYAHLETILLMILYVIVGYISSPQDILMIDVDFSFLTIVLAIITLFHGISSGLLAMAIVIIVMHYSYEEFQYFYYLKELVLVLIYGEFHFFWNSIISHHATEHKYTRQKFTELSKAFYVLKISHDQIEKSYVVKPMSLRNSILKIKEYYIKEKPHDYYEKFLLLLQKTLSIESAFLLAVEDDKSMNLLAQTDSNEVVDVDDLLLKESYAKKMPLYVDATNEHNKSSYLATIPAVSNKKVIGFLVIAKMPFMSFNEDNLTSATILINYMFDEIHKIEIMSNIDNFLPLFQSNFRFESYRLYQLNRKFGTETTVLIFKSYNKLNTHLLQEMVQKNLRILDVMSYIKREEFDIIAILFPFADSTSADGFVDRIYNNTGIVNGDTDVKYTSLSIKDVELIEEYIKDVA